MKKHEVDLTNKFQQHTNFRSNLCRSFQYLANLGFERRLLSFRPVSKVHFSGDYDDDQNKRNSFMNVHLHDNFKKVWGCLSLGFFSISYTISKAALTSSATQKWYHHTELKALEEHTKFHPDQQRTAQGNELKKKLWCPPTLWITIKVKVADIKLMWSIVSSCVTGMKEFDCKVFT